RLHSVPWRWVRAPAADASSPEIDTLYLEGTTAPGAAPGKRFPTASGRLEFFTDALENKFQAIGLSALPEFYSEREQLVDMPHLELLDTDADEGVISPFTSPSTWGARARLVAPTSDGPGARLRAQGFDTELVTGRPPAAHSTA
ncbi:MAG TPA: oxidoreductase, partial [Burkholderiaceae bacterium]|nr:oxidoreductase [Burkholderiaceae bacterium]